ncbi:MAG: response regulator [Deltaproteobacteria bacterium]|nr:response regulator [Deltaproteobacteria bacterium]
MPASRMVKEIQLNHEIEARKCVEEALVKSKEELRQASRMEALGTLVAGMAHEINNPINLIIFNMPLLERIWIDFLPVLKDIADKEPGRKYGGLTYDFLRENLIQLISDVNMAANRVANIVNDLKKFARQSYIFDKKPVQINNAVTSAIRLAQNSISDSRIDVEQNLCHSLPLIEGDLGHIEQVVLNILLNAVQAIGKKNRCGLIKISTGVQDKDGRICIEISDNGRGISPSISDRIFDPFVTDKQLEGGTGLGLSVTHSFVQAHGGEITFQSEQGEGTAFTICFPTKIKEKAARILIVDDDEMIRDMLRDVLTNQRSSYFVDEAHNGLEACIRLGTYRPDLLILDIMMPEMDGLGVCRAIKKDPALAGLKVMITTGNRDHPKLKQVFRLGFTNIHYKPLKIQTFLKEVDRLVNS